MKKSFLTISFSLFLGLLLLVAQSYEVADIENSDKEDMQYEAVGKVGSRYWIYKNVGGIATIAQYNDRMQLVKQNDLSFIKTTNLNGIEFITNASNVYVFFQFQVKSTVYAAVAELNSDGLLVGSPRVVDSADKIRPGTRVKVFNLLESEDHQKNDHF